jgi:hypothetical protein
LSCAWTNCQNCSLVSVRSSRAADLTCRVAKHSADRTARVLSGAPPAA